MQIELTIMTFVLLKLDGPKPSFDKSAAALVGWPASALAVENE